MKIKKDKTMAHLLICDKEKIKQQKAEIMQFCSNLETTMITAIEEKQGGVTVSWDRNSKENEPQIITIVIR